MLPVTPLMETTFLKCCSTTNFSPLLASPHRKSLRQVTACSGQGVKPPPSFQRCPSHAFFESHFASSLESSIETRLGKRIWYTPAWTIADAILMKIGMMKTWMRYKKQERRNTSRNGVVRCLPGCLGKTSSYRYYAPTALKEKVLTFHQPQLLHFRHQKWDDE